MNLLLIEDHKDIAEIIFEYFDLKGYSLDYANNGKQGLELATKNHYDVVILDIMLPKMDGLNVCRKLRQQGFDTPVLMLTARDHKTDILDGFENRADDYLIKPFDLNILEARVNALHRRKSGSVSNKIISFGELSLDLANQIATREEKQFALNQTQFVILKLLMSNAPNLVNREELITAIWPEDEPDGDILRSHIYQLRNLIDKPFKQPYIQTVPKRGYQLDKRDS